ncbi:hypothetical protein [Streptomyces pseudogriseolus]|uniref:hypothetical protein n=1 Tax=Streptomyces pseudogriseolus TaxID=36817 RepID=UPI003FA1D250
MTITDLIPVLKGTGRRRAADKVEELRRDLKKAVTFLYAAGDEIALLRNDLADAHKKQGEAEELVVKQLADIDELTEERDYWRDTALALQKRFAAELAAEANASAITVPPMVRDTSAIEDQATGPIDVSPLWEAAATGRLGPVTDPGRIGPDDDTQPIPAA